MILDSEDKVLAGIRTDGTVEWSVGVPTSVREYVKEQLELKVDKEENKSLIDSSIAESMSLIDNPEYIKVETDSEGKVLGGRTNDGAAFENVGIKTAQLEICEDGVEGFRNNIGVVSSDVSYSTSQSSFSSAQEIFNLKKETKALSDEINSLKLTKNGTTQDEVIVNLRNTSKKKLILNLHKRTNTGDAQSNDVFLPHANDNFSDIRVFDNTGKRLSYKTIYCGDFDIVPTRKFGHNAITKPWQNSNGDIIYSGSVTDYKPGISTDNGETWSILTSISEGFSGNVYISFIDKDDTIFIGDGPKLYRSSYPYTSKELVLDISDTNGSLVSDNAYTGCHITSENICQHPDGEIFLGSYQYEKAIRIFKSINGGLTWVKVHHTTEYQHVHNIMCDTNQTPIVIYAGCDDSNGLYYSKDKGNTWIDLNADGKLIRSVDYGVIYASNGFRLLGGETQHQGGYSIIRTSDDVHFTSVLGAGQACFMCYKLGNTLFAGLLSTLSHKCTQIVVSQDNGLTWNTAYTTMGVETSTASDGFRYMQKLVEKSSNKEYLVVGCQNSYILDQDDLIIYKDDNSHFAEIIVEVPEGATSVKVESGYLISDNKEYVNDSIISNKLLEIIPINDSLLYESCSRKYISGDFLLSEPLKKLGNITEPIINGESSMSILSSGLPIKEIQLDISKCHAITISFWLKAEGSYSFDIINGIKMWDSHFTFNNTTLTPSEQNTLSVAKKFDLILDFDNDIIMLYTNGSQYNYNTLIQDTVTFGTYKERTSWILFDNINASSNVLISEFTIRNGVISQEESYNEYYSRLNDNINF